MKIINEIRLLACTCILRFALWVVPMNNEGKTIVFYLLLMLKRLTIEAATHGSVKRYSPEYDQYETGVHVTMEEDASGDWVEYSEYQKLVKLFEGNA